MIGDRWGVTDDEVVRRYPCDEWVSQPALQAWRAVTIDAPPQQVWPWVAQIRLAPYSYDWIDNLGRRSPQGLRELPDPQVGDPFTTSVGRQLGRILAVEPGQHFTGQLLDVVMSYVLVPTGDHQTRLLLKLTGSTRLFAPMLSLGDLVMARRQLLNLKRLAGGPPAATAR